MEVSHLLSNFFSSVLLRLTVCWDPSNQNFHQFPSDKEKQFVFHIYKNCSISESFCGLISTEIETVRDMIIADLTKSFSEFLLFLNAMKGIT